MSSQALQATQGTHPTTATLNTSAKPLYQGEARIWIDAAPEHVYALVSDLSRMGEYSPECYRVEWLDGSTDPVVGARFRGDNRSGPFKWSRVSEILVADPAREFTFQTVATRRFRDSTVWRYTFEPADGGTLVTESYSLRFASFAIRLFERLSGRPERMPANMQQTLERIKAAAEQVHRNEE